MLVALVCYFVIFYARGPLRPGSNFAVVGFDGQQQSIRTLRADALLPIVFLNSDGHEYLEYRGEVKKIHGPWWGHGKGRLLLSPDKKKLLVMRRYKGLESGGIMIDFESGTMTDVDGYFREFEKDGWTRVQS